MGMNETTKPVCPKCGAALPASAPAGLCPRCLMAMNLATQTVLPEDQAGPPRAAAAPPPAPAEIAPHFPQFDILECLGRGGMGVVYKARQKSLNRLVALKLLAPERVGDPQFAERFTREAQALAALNHPNIVTIHDFGQAGGFYYLLMEFVDGVNLRQAMKAGRFTPEQALAVVPPVCEALQYAHNHGIVHRDIKPENLLLDREGRVMIADFGIAKMLGSGASNVGLADSQPAGTPQYMAPEQQTAPQRVDNRADIYSLGVVLYEMLTGELPGKPLEPPSHKVQIDVRLDAVVLRALEKKPELRYQQVSDVKTMVETIATTPPPASPPASPVGTGGASVREQPSTPPRFSRTAIVGALWILVLPTGLLINTFATLYNAEQPRHDVMRYVIGLPGIVLIVLGMLGFFGTTLLGWISVTQIRRSAGKLRGLWLAVFDGLFFPLLALDASIFLPIILLFPKHTEGDMIPVWLILMLAGLGVFTVVTAIVANFLITRAVWRAVNKPLDGATAKPEAVSPRRKQIVFACLAVQLIILSLLGVRYYNWRWEKTHWHSLRMVMGDYAKSVAGVLRIAEVTRQGRIVIIRIACESGQMPVDFQVSYNGQEIESLPPAAATPSLTALYAPLPPQSDSVGLHRPGVTLVGSRWERRMDKITLQKPGEIMLGFVLPDEARAEMAVQQARKIYPSGRTFRSEKSGMLFLFWQQRNVGKKNSEELQAVLNVDFAAAPSPAASRTSAPTFGPVIEREVIDSIDFDSGRLLRYPAKWLAGADSHRSILSQVAPTEREGLDAALEAPDVFVGVGMKAAPLGNEAWEQMPAAEVRARLAGGVARNYQQLLPDGKRPVTVAFQTGDGGVGLLQIFGYADAGMKLRYKLVQSGAATPDANAFTFGPELGCTMPMNQVGLTPLRDLDYGGPVPDPNPNYTDESLMRLKKPGLAIRHDPAAHKLIFYGMSGTIVLATRAASVLADQWEKITDTELLGLAQRNSMAVGGYVSAESADNLPQTVLFKTGAGKLGILQVTDFIANPPGVKLRYKLVQGGPASFQPAQLSAPLTNAPTFGPAIELVLTNRSALDLVSGNMSTVPESALVRSPVAKADDSILAWMQRAGVDFAFPGDGWIYGTMANAVTFRPGESAGYTPERLAERLQGETAGVPGVKFRWDVSTADAAGINTFGFKCHDGRLCLFEITGLSDDPRGVRLRYRLVRPAEPLSSTAH